MSLSNFESNNVWDSPLEETHVPHEKFIATNVRRAMTPLLGAMLWAAPLSSAQAQEPPSEGVEPEKSKWGGLQLKTSIVAETKMTDRTSWTGMVANFTWPEFQTYPFFAFTGPKFQLTKSFWVAPQGGISTGFLGKEWGATSLVMGLNGKKASLFGFQDVYFRPRETATYTFLSADWQLRPKVRLGVHTEGVNKDFTVGPHLHWQPAQWLDLGLQTYTSPQTGETSLRLATQFAAF